MLDLEAALSLSTGSPACTAYVSETIERVMMPKFEIEALTFAFMKYPKSNLGY